MLAPVMALALGVCAQSVDTALSDFLGELGKAMKQYPKDAELRGKLTGVAKTKFDTALKDATQMEKPGWDFLSDMLNDLSTADKKFGTEGSKAERTLWVAACKNAFTRRLTFAKEKELTGDEAARTDKVFSDLFDGVGKAKKRFGDTSIDLRSAGYQAAKDIFTVLLKNARASEREPSTVYAEQLTRIDKSFPIVTETEKKGNSEPNGVLKTAAKSALDRAIAANK